MGSDEAGIVDLLEVLNEGVHGRLALGRVDAGSLKSVEVAPDKGNIAHEGDGPVTAVHVGNSHCVLIEAIGPFLVGVEVAQVKNVDSVEIGAAVGEAGHEHVGQADAGGDAGQQLGVALGDELDGLDLGMLRQEVAAPFVEELSLLVHRGVGEHPHYELVALPVVGAAVVAVVPAVTGRLLPAGGKRENHDQSKQQS